MATKERKKKAKKKENMPCMCAFIPVPLSLTQVLLLPNP